MSIPSGLETLVGSWTGTNVLFRPWLAPAETESSSRSVAKVELVARETFLSISYDWALDGERNEGLLLISRERKENVVHVFWTDSWHMRDQALLSRGEVREDGVVDVFGTYPVPGHPDWGWRTEFGVTGSGGFEFVMYNVTPDGEEAVAVRSSFERAV